MIRILIVDFVANKLQKIRTERIETHAIFAYLGGHVVADVCDTDVQTVKATVTWFGRYDGYHDEWFW